MARCREETLSKKLKQFNIYDLYYNHKLNKSCCICQETNHIIRHNNKYYCIKHYKQIYKHGKILNRTNRDDNEIIKYNTYAEVILYNSEQKEIARTKIDLEDIDKIKKYKWHLHNDGYCVTNINSSILRMHRLILDFPEEVDHINRNKLDNRRANLRICHHQNNMCNQSLRTNNTSNITGVWWDTTNNKWASEIMVNYNKIWLGYSQNKIDAIIKRLIAETKYFNNFKPNNKYDKEIIKMTINEIVNERNNFKYGSKEWNTLNNKKIEVLELLKPNTSEIILYFNPLDLSDIPIGFIKTNNLPNINQFFGKRSYCEYNPNQIHPIPYIIVQHKDKYFFTIREKGSNEVRLLGKKGMIGGHIGVEDFAETSSLTIKNGMEREIKEEAGIVNSMIKSITLKGLIKSNDNETDQDHLGCIYEIELNTDKIKAEEDGVLTGLWIDKKDLEKHYDSFESWSRIVYDNILKFE